MEVGRTFESFSELEVALGELRKDGCHPLRVFNSQTAIDYNKKRLSSKNPVEPMDTEKFRYTADCVSVRKFAYSVMVFIQNISYTYNANR